MHDLSRPIYIHVINRLRNARAEELFAAMAEECLPLYAEHGLQLHNCWQSAEGHGHSPETLEVWELENFETYSAFIAASHSETGDPRIRAWHRMRDDWVASSDSLLCIAHPNSPTIAELKQQGTKAKLAVHEYVYTKPSKQADYLDGVYRLWWTIAQQAGRSLLGLYYSPWNNRRAINIWGVGAEWDKLPVWGHNYNYDADEFKLWMTMGLALRDDWDDRFLVPAPFSTAR